MATIKLHDILWRTKNAGASPDDNRRTELYFAGCRKALSGHPCKNCFNPTLWDSSHHIPHDVTEIVDVLDMHNIPKHITIVGGEPTDQLDGLKELIPLLKIRGYETILFSWRGPSYIEHLLGQQTILDNLSYVVCGPYMEEYRIYDTSKDDGIHNVIGSSNQTLLLRDPNKFNALGRIPVEDIEKAVYPYVYLKTGAAWRIDGKTWNNEKEEWSWTL